MKWAARLAASSKLFSKQTLRLTSVTFFVALLSVTALSGLLPQTAHAEGTAYWKKGTDTLIYNGSSFEKTGASTFTNKRSGGTSGFGDCNERIVFSGDYHKAKTAEYSQIKSVQVGTAQGPEKCIGEWESPTKISIAVTLADGGGQGSGANNGDDTEPALECSGWSYANPLNWLVCPLIMGMGKAADGMDSLINRWLCIDRSVVWAGSQSKVCGDETSGSAKSQQAFHNAWNIFRIFALAIIVIAGLVMIVSQAAGFEIFDAYTIRKVLPRLLIAAIGITLSWPLMNFLVGFSNVLGAGVRSIIYAPFQGNFDMSIHLGLGATGVADAGLLIGLASLGILGLLSFVVTAFLAVMVAFLTLAFRNMLIYFLVILAPIAIACYVLPNTQKVWSYWWNWFFMGLMAFPIIEAFIAIGRVFAAVTQGSGGVINQMMAFVAYLLPYFLLPFAFRLAGGAIGTVGGLVNDRSRGGFDRLKKYRANTSAQNLQQMRTGSRFGKSKIMQATRLSSPLDKMTARATTRNLGFGEEGRAAYTDKMNNAAAEFSKTAAGNALQHNEPVLMAMTYRNAAEARASMAKDWGLYKYDADGNITNMDEAHKETEKAIAGVQAAGGFGKERAVWATKALAATGTAYENQAQMFSTIARVSDGNDGTASMLWGDTRAMSERAGRNDLKSGFASGQKLIHRIMSDGAAGMSGDELYERYKTGYAKQDAAGNTMKDERGRVIREDNGFLSQALEASRGVDDMSLARNKPKSTQNFSKHLREAQDYYQTVAADPEAYSNEERLAARKALGQIQARYEGWGDASRYAPAANTANFKSQEVAEAKKANERMVSTGAAKRAHDSESSGLPIDDPRIVARMQEEAKDADEPREDTQ